MTQSLLITPVGGSIVAVATALITILAGWLVLKFLSRGNASGKATPRVQ